ncbi:hypothetical protein F4776DRAFT_671349 [Hypoxylon sp. NC0597]|nr:hypothetical protein F4776DRAFT_671349 [Hypoxylon sp. NC0597]
MLPDCLVGCYAQYKEDTKVFTTWLGQAARACGYQVDAQKTAGTSAQTPGPSQRLKGKARKAAKKEAEQKATEAGHIDEVNVVKYAVTTEQLLLQADLVYNNKANIPMPLAIKASLERSIKIRRRCSEWFERNGSNIAETTKDGHLNFIKVLETILEKLSSQVNQPKAEGNRKTSAKSARAGNADVELQNRFSQLTVDYIDDSFELTATQVAITTTKKAKGQQPRSVDVFELEAKKEHDKVFAIFCLFEDLFRIKNHVQQTWIHHQSGKINLVAASIITHAAICAIRREEEYIYARFFPQEPKDNGFLRILAAISPAAASGPAEPGSSEGFEVVAPDKPDAFNFFPIHLTLLKFPLIPSREWPPLITPLSVSFLLKPHLRDLPGLKKGIQQDQILSQLLIAMMELDINKDRLPKDSRPCLGAPTQEDIFTSTMRPVWKEGNVSVASVVASQIILDILEINDYAPEFHGKLMDFRAYVDESLNFERLEDSTLIAGRLQWPRSSFELIPEIYETLGLIYQARPHGPRNYIPNEALTYENAHPIMLDSLEDDCEANGIELGSPEELSEKIRAQNLGFIEVASETNFVILQNPLYLGVLAFKLATLYEEAGIVAANAHLSVFTCAHVYNALRQLRGMSLKWPVMETVIEDQKRPIFADEIPTTLAAIINRLSLRRKDKKRAKFNCRPWSEAFRSLLADKDSPARALYLIEQYIKSIKSKTESIGEAAETAPETGEGPRKSTADRLLTDLKENVPLMLHEMSIDYVRLTKRCNRLIIEILRCCHADLEAHGLPGISNIDLLGPENKTLAVNFLGQFLETLRAANEVGNAGKPQGAHDKRKQTPSQEPEALNEYRYGPYLLAAHKVFEKFLAEEDIDFRVPSIMAGSPGTVIDETT